jgi:hypothetical protein
VQRWLRPSTALNLLSPLWWIKGKEEVVSDDLTATVFAAYSRYLKIATNLLVVIIRIIINVR